MDHFDRAIIQLLVEQENLTFNQIQGKVNFSHSTLQQHLEELLDKGIIERTKKASKQAWKTYIHHNIPENLKGRPLNTVLNPGTNWAVLSFDTLRR